MTISPNCFGSVSRPCVSTLSWKALAGARRAAGRARPRRPGRSARAAPATISPAVRSSAPARFGIDPDPHRIVAAAEQPHVADTVDPGQPVAHLGQRVVGDIAAIERIVGRDEVHDHQEVGRGLARDDAEPLHVLGQARHRDRDAVLHQHLRRIEVGADLEGDGDRDVAVAGRLRRSCRACCRRR